MADKFVTHNASGSGDGTSVANAWTMAQALTSYNRISTAFDRLLVCNTGTYTYPNGLPAAQMNFTNAGTDDFPLWVQGADAYGTPYEPGSGNYVTFDGSADTGMTASNSIFAITTANSCIRFCNIYFKSSKSCGVSLNAVCNLFFHDCRFGYNVLSTATGLYTNTSSATAELHRCRLDHNQSGMQSPSSSRGRFHFYDCSIDHNTSHGITDSIGGDAVQRLQIVRCLIYRNSGSGLYVTTASGNGGLVILDSVFHANGGHGIDLGTSAVYSGEFIFENCVFTDHSAVGKYAVYGASGTGRHIDQFLMRNCCAYGNTGVLYAGAAYSTFPGTGHCYVDPQFVDTTDGSENFQVQNSDLARQLVYPAGGTSNYLIGAFQNQTTSSGSGLGLNSGVMGVI